MFRRRIGPEKSFGRCDLGSLVGYSRRSLHALPTNGILSQRLKIQSTPATGSKAGQPPYPYFNKHFMRSGLSLAVPLSQVSIFMSAVLLLLSAGKLSKRIICQHQCPPAECQSTRVKHRRRCFVWLNIYGAQTDEPGLVWSARWLTRSLLKKQTPPSAGLFLNSTWVAVTHQRG